MIVEDRYGNVYKINTPSYQAGGLVLPQYSGSQVTIQPPQSNLLNVPVNNDWNRGMQMDQLNMQREAAAANTVNDIINTKIKLQTQERLNKQMDLQNKKLEWDQLQEGAKQLEQTLIMDKDMFLQGDQAVWDEILKQNKLDAASIASTPASDINTIFKNRSLKASLMYSQKEALNNKQNFLQANKALEVVDKDLKRAYEISKLGYLDENVLMDFQNSATNLAKKQAQLANGTLKGWDMYSDPDYIAVNSAPSFIDAGEQKLVFDTQQQISSANIQKSLAQAAEDTANAKFLTGTLDSRIKLNEAKANLDVAKAGNEINDMQFEQEQRKLQDADWNLWLQENPNATSTERSTARNTIYSGKVGAASGPLSVAELYTQSYAKGDEEGMQAAMDFQTANNNKTTSVNYTTDGNGRQGITDDKGITNWGGYRTKGNDFVDGSFGGLPVSLENPAHKKLFEEGKLVFKDGKLRIKGNTVAKDLFGVSQSWGDFWEINDSVIQNAIPGIIQDGEYWEIPYDNKPLPQQTTNTPSSINPAFKVNGGATAVPANAKDVL